MTRKTVPLHLAVPVAGLLLIAACGGDDDAAGSAAPTTDGAPTATEPAAPESTEAPASTTTEAAPATTPAPPPASTQPPAPDLELIGPGPYDVGVATITVDDPDGERPLTVDVWFPLTDGATGLSPQQYTLLPGVYYESPSAFAATPDLLATGESFPLVVYSHGSGGLRYIHSSYTEALASHGYLVAAPDHTGNTAVDRLVGAEFPGEQTAFLRPNDVRRVIDAFTDPSHPAAGPWAGQVDAEQIAVTGHSFGGFTSVAMVTGFSNVTGSVEADERVDAIIPLAPATGSALLADDVLSLVDVPMMVIVGTDDVTTPVEPNVTRLWDLNDNSPAYRIELVAGEHQTFTDLCAYTRFLPQLADVPQAIIDTIDSFAVEGCSEGDIDDVRAAELTNTYAIAFLDQVFRGGDPIVATHPGDVLFQAR